MATFYPKISGNTNSKLDLISTSPDQNFDVYVFENNNTGQQTAFLLFVIKNTHASSESNLVISDIIGGGSFDQYFTIDPVEEGTTNLLMGLGSSDNVLQGTASSTGTSYGDAETTNATTGECTGASAFIGHVNGLSQNSAGGANAANSSYLIPVYKTSDIIGNNIPSLSYAAFVVKFYSDQVLDIEGTASLTIKNNDTDVVINFNAKIRNPLSYYGVFGTAFQGTNTDQFVPNSELGILEDGGTFDIGIYPWGYNYGSTDKTIEFNDYSNNAGNFEFHFNKNGVLQMSPSSGITLDGSSYASSANNAIGTQDFSMNKNFIHQGKHISPLAGSATQNPGFLQGNPAGNSTFPGTALYKNFSQGTGGYFGNLTHIDLTQRDSTGILSNVMSHISANDCVNTIAYSLGKIINKDNPELTSAATNNEWFAFYVTLGYYSPITFGSISTTAWKKTRGLPENKRFDYYFSNLKSPPSGEKGPWIPSTTSTHLTRGESFNLNIHFRYNYFTNKSITGAGTDGGIFTFDTFQLDNELLSFDKGKSFIKPTSYTYGLTNEVSSNTDVPTNGANVSNTQFDKFSNSDNSGNFLGLHYAIPVDGFKPSDMYPTLVSSTGTSSANRYLKVADFKGDEDYKEGHWGVFTGYVEPSYNNGVLYSSLFKQSGHGSIRYKVAFLPKRSYLRLLSSGDDNVVNSQGAVPVPNCRLFTDATTTSEKEYPMLTSKIMLEDHQQWRIYNTTTPATSYPNNPDVSESNEGLWYGAGLVSVLRPPCWGDQGSSFEISHNIMDWKRRVGGGNSYEKRWFEEPVNYYFKLPSASYNSSSGVWRSVGRFYFDNTGDYPIYMQQIEVKTKNFDLCGLGDNDHYQRTQDALMPKVLNDSSVEVAQTYVPSPGNSATPTWGISKGRYNGDSTNFEVWKDTSINEGSGYSNNTVRLPDNLGDASKFAFDHYTVNNTFSNTNNYSSVSNSNKQLLIEPQISGDDWARVNNETHGVQSKEFVNSGTGLQNYIDVTFELDPVNVAAHDNGTYYAQICMTYYVDDYESRHSSETDGAYNTNHHIQKVGQNHNAHTRLRVSKYLVAVDLLSEAEIKVVDSEDDAVTSTITMPDLKTG